MTGAADEAPLASAYERTRRAGRTPFAIPGHKGSTHLLGAVVAGDVPLHGGMDTMRLDADLLGRAERRAAELWGADWCRFSVAGSTHGNQALALAVGRPGDEVVVTRALHRSLLLGLVLAGLRPVWVTPQVDPPTGLPLGVPADRLAAALAAHPAARAVFLVEPGYLGNRSELAELVRVAHDRDVPVLVDQAWAAHFGFHPDLPPHALQVGADALVTSAHKALPAHTQAAIVLARTRRLPADRLERAFEATHTTSPAGPILASTDGARALLAADGPRLLGEVIRLVASARERLAAVPGLLVPGRPGVLDAARLDPTRLVLGLAGTGADGRAVEADLVAAGMPVELADRTTVVATVTMADTAAGVEAFVRAVTAAIERHRGAPRPPLPPLAWGLQPEQVVDPRTAFFADRRAVPWADAAGRVCAELVAPYPPGVPVLAPGERVRPEVLDGLAVLAAAGVRIAYAADPTLATLQVLAD